MSELRPSPTEAGSGPAGTGAMELVLHQERSAGAFARVYLAEANSADGISRIVAVKVLKDRWGENPELLERTRDEARLLARLRHKNILRVEALTHIEGRPALVMEFVDGVDLKQIVRTLGAEGRKVPPKVAYKIADRICSALAAAYDQVPYGRREPMRVVHRDIKPSNVMVSVEGEVKVLDFGTARFSHEIRAAHTSVLRFGSMKYMSPERKMGDRGEHTSDVYALGLVMIEVLTGGGLEALPGDRRGHDAALNALLDQITETALPDERWNHSLRQTLLRMCAWGLEDRFTAAQATTMLCAFAEQATGPSLEAFADSDVSRITRQVFGDVADGVLSGSRVFVRPEPSDAGQGASGPSASGPGPSNLARSAEPAPTRSEPARAEPSRPEPRFEPTRTPLGDAPTMVTPQPQPRQNLRQPTALGDLPPPPPPTHPSERLPADRLGPPARPAAAPTTAAPAPISAGRAADPAPPAAARAAAPAPRSLPIQSAARAEPAPPSGNKRPLIILGVAAAVAALGLGCAGLAGGAWYWSQTRGVDAPATADAAPAGPNPLAEEGAPVTLTIAVGDSQIQWVRVEDADGAQRFDSKKQGSASLAAGRYTVSAKVAGRKAARAEVLIEDDLRVACVPEPKAVVCASEDGATRWVLEGS
ncbi:MAG: protein kinase [Deltaproteobacteria bacterium]|jgi:serine/threonine protein kinase|nr:protein kinase [Deltaproteobacteria bacterium]